MPNLTSFKKGGVLCCARNPSQRNTGIANPKRTSPNRPFYPCNYAGIYLGTGIGWLQRGELGVRGAVVRIITYQSYSDAYDVCWNLSNGMTPGRLGSLQCLFGNGIINY